MNKGDLVDINEILAFFGICVLITIFIMIKEVFTGHAEIIMNNVLAFFSGFITGITFFFKIVKSWVFTVLVVLFFAREKIKLLHNFI